MPPPRKPLPVVGQAAEATPGADDAGPAGGDWLGEITGRAPTDPRQGVPAATRTKGDRQRGRAVESRRGHHNG